jgi:hypothetical protein
MRIHQWKEIREQRVVRRNNERHLRKRLARHALTWAVVYEAIAAMDLTLNSTVLIERRTATPGPRIWSSIDFLLSPFATQIRFIQQREVWIRQDENEPKSEENDERESVFAGNRRISNSQPLARYSWRRRLRNLQEGEADSFGDPSFPEVDSDLWGGDLSGHHNPDGRPRQHLSHISGNFRRKTVSVIRSQLLAGSFPRARRSFLRSGWTSNS